MVVCTAYDQFGGDFLVARYPHLRYLVKPVASEDILKALDAVIREARARDAGAMAGGKRTSPGAREERAPSHGEIPGREGGGS